MVAGHTSVTGNLWYGWVQDDAGLDVEINFDGLESLNHLGGLILGEYHGYMGFCESNNKINNLKGLRNVTNITNDLDIKCTRLNELGLDNLNKIGGRLTIGDNPNLPIQSAYELRDQVLSREGIGGGISIY